MNQVTNNSSDEREIDLSQISNKINGFFQKINRSIFKSIRFFINKKLIIGGLIVAGVGLGLYLDRTEKVYDHLIVVKPNFSSVDYLYEKVNLLQSKIKEKDTLFLKSIGIQNSKGLNIIEVEPIIDIYTFVNDKINTVTNAQNTQNFELVKLFSEDGDINKVIKDPTTSKNFAHHQIHIQTDRVVSDKNTIEPILNYLNKNQYFEDIRKVYAENTINKIAKNEETVNQINSLLSSLSDKAGSSNKNDKLVYVNENTQLNDLVQTKTNLTNEIGNERIDLIETEKTIKPKSYLLNKKNTKGVNSRMKLVLPLLFISLYLIIYFFSAFYNKQLLLEQQNKA